ncbi:MAG: hypothetical protein ACPLPV_04175, partial [Methanomassiliicoccales archaeon]
GVVIAAFATQDYLFFSPANDRLKKMNTSGVITDAGVSVNSKNYNWFAACNGFVYAGVSANNTVHYATKDDLSDLEGDDDNDPDVIYIGNKRSVPTLKALPFGTELLVAKPDGLWSIGQDNRARMVLDFSSEISYSNFRVFTIYNGFVYFNIGKKLFQWSGSRINEVTPPPFVDAFPFYGIEYFADGKTFDGYLNILAYYKNSQGVDCFGLFSFDGVGWHKVAEFEDITPTARDSLIYTHSQAGAVKCYVYAEHLSFDGIFHVNLGIYRFNTGNDVYALPPYPTTPSELVTSRLDMGFRMITKVTPSIRIEATIPSSDCRIDVYYSIDDGDWYRWGTVTTSGVTELLASNRLEFAENPPRKTVLYRQLRLKFVFITTNQNYTPILEGVVVRFLLRPDMFRGWSFDIVAASSYEYGDVIDTRTPAIILSELESLRNSKSPVEFVDIFGRKFDVFVSSFVCQAMERHDIQEDGFPNVESLVTVNLVEAR